MKVIAIGNPNVGKSAVLNRLTGSQIFVSNYAGTSVEAARTRMIIADREVSIYDTPGVFSIFSNTDEGRTVRRLLEDEKPDIILNIVDATNLERNLVLTDELMALGIPLLILLNQIDMARDLGIDIDTRLLSERLGHPVISFSATSGEGYAEFIKTMEAKFAIPPRETDQDIIKPRVYSIGESNGQYCSGNCWNCSKQINECTSEADLQRAQEARIISNLVTNMTNEGQRLKLSRIQTWIDKPILGSFFLLFIAYLGFYTLLKFIQLSEGPINALLVPVGQTIEKFLVNTLPPGWFSEIIAQAVPEGLIIPFTIIMPAMLVVGLFMAILEDTGLLPRYSVALERLGSVFGLSGQGIIPLALGFGCRTPAIVASRIMPNHGQRFIIVTLLSIVIPCSATLGVLAAVIAAFNAYLAVIIGMMLLVFAVLAKLLSRMVPREEFIYELPPLRIPITSNVINKIKIRFSGFFTEVLPLLLVMNIAVRMLMDSGALEYFKAMEGFSRALFGIPGEALIAVFITIFQRYLAPLVLINLSLTSREATIAIAMISLSLPCLPAIVMTIRELGLKNLVKIIMMGLATSFSVGIFLNIILPQ
ncbi:MAG: ferrous iron transport protein B [Syntrophomonas sp.]|nr:ferrous iron transport protein B [Syntrophomonas sp.]